MEKRKYSLYKLQVWETFQASQQNTKKLKNFELAGITLISRTILRKIFQTLGTSML